MNRQQQIQKIEEYVRSHQLAVLSTVTHDFLPEASVIGFAVGENLELYFGTHNTYRKWSNLQKNPNVALVIGWEQGKTVQFEGTAVELSAEEGGEVIKKYFADKPTLVKYLSKKEAALFKVMPKWVRFSDNSHDPAEEIEVAL